MRSSIEPLAEGILFEFARLDIADRHAFGRGPLGNASEIISAPFPRRIASGKPLAIDQAAQNANQARRRNGHADLYAQPFRDLALCKSAFLRGKSPTHGDFESLSAGVLT